MCIRDRFEIFSGTKTPRPQQEERVARMVALCRLEDLLDRHPYDLSGGCLLYTSRCV